MIKEHVHDLITECPPCSDHDADWKIFKGCNMCFFGIASLTYLFVYSYYCAEITNDLNAQIYVVT